MKTNLFLLVVLATTIAFSSCNKDDKEVNKDVNAEKTFISEAANDGVVTNSTPQTVSDFYTSGAGRKEITMGWDANGYSMRGFISFNVTSILPASGQTLVIDNAVLNVFQANSNLFPFADNKTMLCYLLDYGITLDAADYDAVTISSCGVIASASKGVLDGFSINITSVLNSYISSVPLASRYQFRLQSNSLSNVTSTSSQAQAMWNIFAGDQPLMAGNDYRPQLTIKYHYQTK